MNKRVTCITCGQNYRVPLLDEAMAKSDNLDPEYPRAEFVSTIACPSCGTQNDVREDLPDW